LRIAELEELRLLHRRNECRQSTNSAIRDSPNSAIRIPQIRNGRNLAVS
jgi:hypothetical protein